jgi:hypothetical protein
MGIHTTKYKTENGKTKKVKGDSASKNAAPKNGAAGSTPGADGKSSQPGNPAKQGA